MLRQLDAAQVDAVNGSQNCISVLATQTQRATCQTESALRTSYKSHEKWTSKNKTQNC